MNDDIVHHMNDFHSFHHNAVPDSVENDFHFHFHCCTDCNSACVDRDDSLDSEVAEHFDSYDDSEMVLADRKIHWAIVVLPDPAWNSDVYLKSAEQIVSLHLRHSPSFRSASDQFASVVDSFSASAVVLVWMGHSAHHSMDFSAIECNRLG